MWPAIRHGIRAPVTREDSHPHPGPTPAPVPHPELKILTSGAKFGKSQSQFQSYSKNFSIEVTNLCPSITNPNFPPLFLTALV